MPRELPGQLALPLNSALLGGDSSSPALAPAQACIGPKGARLLQLLDMAAGEDEPDAPRLWNGPLKPLAGCGFEPDYANLGSGRCPVPPNIFPEPARSDADGPSFGGGALPSEGSGDGASMVGGAGGGEEGTAGGVAEGQGKDEGKAEHISVDSQKFIAALQAQIELGQRAQSAIELFLVSLNSIYNLQPGDQIDFDSGRITRA